MSTNKLITLITGANQGIGYYAAQKLAGTGKHMVLIGSRDLKKGQKAIDDLALDKSVSVNKADLEAVELDLDSDISITAAAEKVDKKYGRLDILVNNAGISLGAFANKNLSLRQQFQTLYNTNVFGQTVCTDAFLPLLHKSNVEGGKRIVFVSSCTGSLTLTADPERRVPGSQIRVYSSSKTAENMIMMCFGNLLENDGFTVCSICPGYCGTNMNGYAGYKDPRDGATPIIHALEGRPEDVNRQFVHAEAEGGRYPW